MDRPERGENVSSDASETDWQVALNICAHYVENCQEILDEVVEFRFMWNEHLGQLYWTSHYIELILTN